MDENGEIKKLDQFGYYSPITSILQKCLLWNMPNGDSLKVAEH